MSKTQDLYLHAKTRIPGGVQLFSKRPEKFAPDQWPAYFSKAKGCEVWDLDGNHYYDMTTNGIGSCLLGYADPDVTAAVVSRVENGCMSTLNPPEEVELADKLCEIHPWASNVRFARTGGECCSIAVRIARATTGRNLVAICGYHGWSDWYIAANLGDDSQLDGQLLPGLQPDGVPRQLQGTALTFNSHDWEAFDSLIKNYGDQLACIIMEPFRNEYPQAGWLEHIRDEAHRVGALLIFDEITIGWRLTFGGSHKLTDVHPDIAVFAKALGNGHPIAAVVGTEEAMKGAHTSFISSTYWTESVGPTAALAVLDKMEKSKVWDHIKSIGEIVQKDWTETAEKYNLPVKCSGFPCLAHFEFTQYPTELKTLYTALMLKEGFLGSTQFYPTLAHNDGVLDLHRAAVDRVFEKIGKILETGNKQDVLDAIGGPVCQKDFKRLVK